MPCCSAFGCSKKLSKGKLFHRFPRDPQRRKKWEAEVRRKAWKSHLNSFLCEDHFDETQYESHRADGLKKLKPNAIPTLFVFTKSKPQSGPLNLKKFVPIVPQETPEDAKKKISRDHSYCTTTDEPDEPAEPQCDEQQDIPDLNGAALDLTCNSQTSTVNPTDASCPFMNCAEKMKALTNRVLRLQQALARERKEKWKVVRQRKQLEEKMSRVFNKDQIAKLSQSSTRGTKWSEETIKKGLQLQLVCGAAGYELLLAQEYPLPSARSLRRMVAEHKRMMLEHERNNDSSV